MNVRWICISQLPGRVPLPSLKLRTGSEDWAELPNTSRHQATSPARYLKPYVKLVSRSITLQRLNIDMGSSTLKTHSYVTRTGQHFLAWKETYVFPSGRIFIRISLRHESWVRRMWDLRYHHLYDPSTCMWFLLLAGCILFTCLSIRVLSAVFGNLILPDSRWIATACGQLVALGRYRLKLSYCKQFRRDKI